MTRFSIATGVSMIIYMSIYICEDLFPGADTRGMGGRIPFSSYLII